MALVVNATFNNLPNDDDDDDDDEVSETIHSPSTLSVVVAIVDGGDDNFSHSSRA
jgi:hypothetical protein